MTDATLLDRYFAAIAQEGLYPDQRNLKFYLEYLFDGVALAGKSFLEVGGGSGWLSFYARCRGAARVVCLEPEAAGSTADIGRRFQRLAERIGTQGVALEPLTLQEYSPSGATFDVILLHNSINHLDEEACIALRRDPEARERYAKMFTLLARLARPQAVLIASDCTPYNLFDLLRLPNPFVPTIEWRKHQSPWTWARLLDDAGFGEPRIRWTSFNSLRSPGRALLGNVVASYFLTSEFCLTMRRRKGA